MEKLSAMRLLRTGLTCRYHTIPTDQARQSVAEHSWGVAALILRFHPNPSTELVKAAIFHDCAESEYGDIPAQVKWANPQLHEMFESLEAVWLQEQGLMTYLTPEETRWLRCCDLLEGYYFCGRQTGVGYAIAFGRYREAILEAQASGMWPEQLKTGAPE